MEIESRKTELSSDLYALEEAGASLVDHGMMNFFSREEIMNALDKIIEFKNFFQRSSSINVEDELTCFTAHPCKKSFLVFKRNKYFTISTTDIAYFYVKYGSSVIVRFDSQEYYVNYSLEQIQNLVADRQFFRLNRQYLVNFSAVKETEHYFARKLLVNLIVPVNEKLLVPKEKASVFLKWLENR